MSNPVNETSQKEHQRNAGKVQEESAEHGLSMAPPPFQLATNPSAPPMDKPSGEGNDGSDGAPVQRKAFHGTPPAKPEESDNNNGSNTGAFQLKASAEASTSNPQSNVSSQPFQLKKGDDQQHESRESFALQRKAGNSNGGGAESGGGGNVMQKMGAAMGQDFSNVKVTQNSEQATKVGALAYTQGNEMHFAPGQFNPGSKGGQELIGHELAHVVQQREGKVKPTTEVAGKAVNDDKGLEADADAKGAEAAAKLNGGGGAQNLKSGSASGGVTQAKMADDIAGKQKNLGDTVDKGQKESQEGETEDADKQAENTSKVQTPEQKVSKQDQENQSMRQKDREKAKDSGTVDPTKNQTPEDKGKESGVQNRNTPDVNGQENPLQGDQQEAQEQETQEAENTQQDQPQSENADEVAANQETQEAPETETPPAPEGKAEEGKEEKEGEEEQKEGEAEQTPENAEANAQDAQGGQDGQGEGQGGGEGGDGKGGGATALGGGGGGGKEGAGGNNGGGGGKVGNKMGGAGDKPEGDFSKSVRKQLYRVPKSKVGTVPKEGIISSNADGSVIAQKVNPALLTAKSQEQPEGLKEGPVQMKPDPTKNNQNNGNDTITPVPQDQLENYYGDRDNNNDRLLDQFKQNTGAQLTTFEGLAGDIETKLGAAKKKAEGDIRKQTTLIKGRITREHQNAKKRALGEANKTKRILKGWNTTLVANIKKESKGAKAKVKREYDTTMEYLRGMETNMATLISAEVSKGAGDIRAVGTAKGGEAVKIAAQRSGAYAAMPVPSMSGTEKFFNGDTYEQDRHDARVKAATDVGKGYNEQFIQKADEAAKALEGNLPTILQGAQAKITEAIEKVEAKKTAGDKEIEASEKASLDGAQQTLTQFEGMVDTQLQGANGQLDSTKTSQLQAAESQGKNQLKVLDQLHKSAVEGLQKTHGESTESIRNSIQTVIDEVTGMENADPGKVEVILSSAEKSITESVSNLTTSFNQGITDSIKGYETHSGKAKEALTEVGNSAKEALNQVVTDLRGTLADTEKQAKDANKGVLDGHKEGVEKSATKYVDEIKGLKKDVETGFEAVKKNITAEVKKSVDGLTSEFATKLAGIHSEITTKAQEAYDAVKPRWKGWVTFIIKLVIAIAVTVAIGLLAASGVGLLAGLGLAFLIGAAGAILETGLIDLLVEGKFSGFGTYFKNAVLGGIGGMFTFLGARWGAGAGKYLEGALGKFGGSLISSNVMSKIGSYIGEVGVGFAMDMVGTFAKEVSGQLYDNIGSVLRGEGWKGINWGEAWGKTWTWENVAINFGGNLGGKIFGDILTAKGIGGPGGAVVEWLNGNLPRWALSAEHLAKIDAGGGAGGLDVGGGGHGNGADVKTGAPEIKTGEPELRTGEPEIKTNEPEIKTNEPEVKTNEPEVKTNEPEVKTDEPEVKTNEPEVKTNEPEVKTNEPEVKTNEPEVKTEEPEVKSGDAEGKTGDTEVKTDTEGPTTAGGKKSGAQLAEELGYPAAPEGYHWANHQGKGVPVLRRNPVKGGSNLIEVKYDPLTGKFIDPNTKQVFNNVGEVNTANSFLTAPKSPVPIPTTPEFNAFKNSADFKGDDQMAAQAFELFQNGKWTELETFIHQNGLNSNWPPNQGFTSIKPETLAPGVQIDRFGHPGGTFVAPAGTPYTARALPPGTNGKPYNVYEVVKPINVEGGPAIPWFGESGMGIQFKLPMSVQDLINGGFLKLITPP